MYTQRNTTPAKLAQWFLNIVSYGFKTISWVNLRLRGRRKRKFPILIVSIDNLSFGGTGKTTLVTQIGRQLEQRGIKFAVVTRGYRSAMEIHHANVLPTHTAREVGDEPLMMKQMFPSQDIFVGKDRCHSIEEAIKNNNKIILLDDGFQSTHIHRDVKIMLLNPAHPYYYLRNFKSMMKDEDFIFVLGDSPQAAAPYARRFPRVPCGTYSFKPGGFHDPAGQPVDVTDKTLTGFAALGDNRRFRSDLAAFNLAAFIPYPDHHAFSQPDIQHLENQRVRHKADYLVCTPKDFVKIKDLDIKNIPLIYSQNSIQLSLDIIDHLLDRLDHAGNENNAKTPV